MSTSLSIVEQYPSDKYTLLVPIEKTACISEIQQPILSAVKISTKLDDNEIYIQTKAKNGYKDSRGNWHEPEPARYALTKRGLNRLASAAGIEKLATEQLVPSTCNKCALVNRGLGKAAPCGTCGNKDVRYRVTISVPQISGPAIIMVEENEINVEAKTRGMSAAQKEEFIKTVAARCVTGAYNRAIRAALQLKSTYLIEEFDKPFVVAYLAPNLDNPEVKNAAIEAMFSGKTKLFGTHQILEEHSETEKNSMTTAVPEEFDYEEDYIEEPYIEKPMGREVPEDRTMDFHCDKCGVSITEKVYDFSVDRFGRPFCYKCQKVVKNEGGTL